MSETRRYAVELMTRVEGEGRFAVEVEGGEVVRAELSIFEAPRLFEALLRGRSLREVPDIVARICGICPVAYQMSAVRALEDALGIEPPPHTAALRRLLYCGEWIESHALHVFMLHAPDYLGYPSIIAMAEDHRELVERGLRIKRAGNRLIEVLGGRAIHPVSPCVGGFSKTPRKSELGEIRAELAAALDEALEAAAWAATLEAPDHDFDYLCVAVDAGDAYPLEGGDRLAISGRPSIAVAELNDHVAERQVERSNALHCRMIDGSSYLCGPVARLNLFADRLHPTAREALERGALELPLRNPYRSLEVRVIEVVHALAEAIDLIDGYRRPTPPRVEWTGRAGIGHGATEAPRGMLYHRYEIADDDTVLAAQIVPPTSQNQACIEEDLSALVGGLLDLDHGAATARCEQLIRAYDPCISCATHFLDLEIRR